MFSRAVSSISKPAPNSIRGAMLPFTVHVPSVGSSTPAIILSKVDLPEPLVPNMPNTSPFLTSSETWSRARNSLKRSSLRARAMAYSLRLFMVSLAMLKTIDTSSTLIIVSLGVASSSEKEASPKNEVLIVSGISTHLYIEDEFLFKLTENNESNNEHNKAHSKAKKVEF